MIWGPQRVPDFLRLTTHLHVRSRADMRRVITVISHKWTKVVRNYAQK